MQDNPRFFFSQENLDLRRRPRTILSRERERLSSYRVSELHAQAYQSSRIFYSTPGPLYAKRFRSLK